MYYSRDRSFSGLCGEQMTVYVNLLDELERRCQDVLSAIEDVREDGSCMDFGYHYGTRACGKLKRETLRLNEIGVKIRRGDRE